jgi:putative DNA primase/helicase
MPERGPDVGRDFNDLGATAKTILEEPETLSDGWGDPEPLNKPDDPLPYPIEALPYPIREAVKEVQDYAQAPAALVAGCALDTLSTAAQGLRNVKRGERLEGPIGTYRWSLADSGERKTTVDGLFSEPVRIWEREKAEEYRPLVNEYRASSESWEAEKAGIVQRIKELAKGGKDTSDLKRKLADLMKAEPEPIRVPRVLFGDITPEALAWRLSRGWPCGSVLSSEAGIVLGGHGMGSDSIMRNLALLNSLWDGGETRVDRRTSESFIVRGARLTMGLAIQPATLMAFFEQSKGLARGTGFLARFLLSWPASTQGTRLYKEAPTTSPMLSGYQDRITQLLDETQPPGENGLDLPAITFDLAAKRAWIGVYNEIEQGLSADGELSSLRDVASKAADNIARLSAQFAIIEGHDQITEEDIERAALIVTYHLHEARRIFATLKTSPQALLAGKLDTWIIRKVRETAGPIAKATILQYGPAPLRKAKALNRAIETLVEANRVRMARFDGRDAVEINPALLGEEK